ncbi:hypothetical protein B0T19DRAFT_462521 [Cercophora scortea]|uniref:DUF1295-domain-containing protein n=1 Tax=Cercophora scortea TaxID=314031 RepID=A0AAE0M981_9PEZI|nr:hypothetical protein B0T19DRAFT_462521 [Cercophora scortea]
MEIHETTNPWGGRTYVSSTPSPHATPARKPLSHRTFFQSSLFDIGILKDTLLPSLALHTGLATVAYTAGRLTNRLDTKDWLWPTGQVVNAWWSAVGRQVLVDGASLRSTLSALSRPERLILAGVSLWGGRLFYRVAKRAATTKHRIGKDHPRYEAIKKEHGFWNKAFFTMYLPEALFGTFITLPFTAPFRHQGNALSGYNPAGQALAVGVFCAGFALQVLADWQLDEFKEKERREGEKEMCREGVWGVVRHPNFLGDMLMHISFPLMLYSSDMLAWIELLGPVANYIFLRFFGGTKEAEKRHAKKYIIENVSKKVDFDRYRQEINAFWPDQKQISNKWSWIVVGSGVAGSVLEGILTRGF